MVKIVIDNIYSKIVGYLPPSVHNDLKETLSYKLPGAKHIPQVKAGVWDGVIRLYRDSGGQSFYTGLLSFVRTILKKHNIEYQVLDRRVCPEQNMPELVFNPPSSYEERDYQNFTVDKAQQFTRGILKVSTGGGKTMIVTRLINELKTYPFIFYVLTKDLMEQAYDTLSSSLNCKIGRIGDGKADIQKISVCTIQTAIQSFHSDNKKFKLSDYRFDEEDKWNEKSIENAEKVDRIKKFIRLSRAIYFDECVSGDALIPTDKGLVRLDQIKENNCRYVLSYDGINLVYKKILSWTPKGKHDTLIIKFDEGDLTCTKDHLIYTKEGWKEAQMLSEGMTVLFANVDAEHGCQKTNMEEQEITSLGIKGSEDLYQNGKINITNILKKALNVNVDAKEQSRQLIARLNHSLMPEELLDIPNTYEDMTNSQSMQDIISIQCPEKFRQLWELAWEILPSSFQIKDLKTIDYAQLMEEFKKSGLNIRLCFYLVLELLLKTLETQDTENFRQGCGLDVCLALRIWLQKYMMVNVKEFQKNGLDLSEISDWHGGSVMMEVTQMEECLLLLILRDFRRRIILSFQNGFVNKECSALSENQKSIITCFSVLRGLLECLKSYQNMSLNACDIKWKTITKIIESREKQVYDIGVEDTSCFFANNVLVHNCHHAAALTCKEIMTQSTNAYWRFGGSATPYREDNADILIQAMFGAKIVDISASYLIKEGWLIRPYIFFEPVEDIIHYNSYKQIYKNGVVENIRFNKHVADTANHLVSRDLSTLILVQQYKHGDYLKTLIPNSEFITGKLTSAKRKQYLEDLRTRKIKCLIATSLADEGLDVPTLDAVLLAGGGASATRVNQRIGRTLRIDKTSDNPRDRSVVVVYDQSHMKYLKDHTKKVRRILKTEKEFKLLDSKGSDFICNEIDNTFGFKSKSQSIFDV